jgi:Beta protein
MSPAYIPILKAKQGEFDALAHLSDKAKNQIVPWFDISRLDDKSRLKIEQRSEPPVETYLHETAAKIAKVWAGKTLFIDFPQWKTNAQTESGEHVVSYFRNRLELLNVAVNPVVDYSSWDDPVYIEALASISLENGRNFCIRLNLDSDTVEDMADSAYFIDRFTSIVDELGVNPSSVNVMIDFSDVSTQIYSVGNIFEIAEQAISLVKANGFHKIIIAGSSLPPSINEAVKSQNATGLVLRKEMLVWQMLISENPAWNITFADYCIRNPKAVDDPNVYTNANGKIRYTIDKHYFIARGCKLNKSALGYSQFCLLANTIVDSEHYFGNDFSWGDDRIFKYSSTQNGCGNQQTWISIDTNHHIEALLVEVSEFKREIAPTNQNNQGL